MVGHFRIDSAYTRAPSKEYVFFFRKALKLGHPMPAPSVADVG